MGILDAVSTSVTGISAQAYALQNISGNVANSSTVGFKAVNTDFTDMLNNTLNSGQLSGSVSATSTLTNTLAGSTTSTGVNTNMALSGNGFFVVAQNNGSSDTPAFSSQSLYTRRGDFTEDADGYLVNGAGYYLCGSSSGAGGTSPIKLPTTNSAATGQQVPSSVSIGSDGTITGSYADGSTAALGKVAVAQINGTDFMQSENGGAYSATTASGAASLGMNSSTINAGYVEASNTDISDQFSKMIMTQQAYSSNTKVLSSANEMLEDAINMMK